MKEELKSAATERDQLKGEFESASGEAKHLHQSIRAVEIDKEDMNASYREVCQENQRLRDTNSQVIGENKEMFSNLQRLDQDREKLNFTLKDVIEKEQNYITEIRTKEDHVTHLTHQVEQLSRERDDVASFGNSLHQDAENAR